MKKRKRFYNDNKRNQKWTEEEKGRKIDFADKYIEGGESPNKFTKGSNSAKSTAIKKAKKQRRQKNLLIAIACVLLICIGYTAMDVHMTRNAASFSHNETRSNEESGMRDMNISFISYRTESMSLDSSVMLSSVINDTASLGFTSITFDAKRSDGTIGYASKLASVDTYNAASSPASKPKASVKELLANDLLPIARIACYKDNVAPEFIPQAAITTKGGKLYKDEDGNTYLNPDNETTYNYIKDIIVELRGMGVQVFVLNETDLPSELSEKYRGGFDSLAKKLYNDIGSDIKLLEEIDVEIKGKDPKSGEITNYAIKQDIKKFEKTDKNKTYCIKSKIGSKRLVEQLAKNNVTRYILLNQN